MAVNRIYLWKNYLHFPLFASVLPSFLSGFISEVLIFRYDLYNLINQSIKKLFPWWVSTADRLPPSHPVSIIFLCHTNYEAIHEASLWSSSLSPAWQLRTFEDFSFQFKSRATRTRHGSYLLSLADEYRGQQTLQLCGCPVFLSG